jgi:hypothetical protein
MIYFNPDCLSQEKTADIFQCNGNDTQGLSCVICPHLSQLSSLPMPPAPSPIPSCFIPSCFPPSPLHLHPLHLHPLHLHPLHPHPHHLCQCHLYLQHPQSTSAPPPVSIKTGEIPCVVCKNPWQVLLPLLVLQLKRLALCIRLGWLFYGKSSSDLLNLCQERISAVF